MYALIWELDMEVFTSTCLYLHSDLHREGELHCVAAAAIWAAMQPASQQQYWHWSKR